MQLGEGIYYPSLISTLAIFPSGHSRAGRRRGLLVDPVSPPAPARCCFNVPKVEVDPRTAPITTLRRIARLKWGHSRTRPFCLVVSPKSYCRLAEATGA